MAQIFVWDLDDTVISSKHRQRYDEHGNLDLAHWIANHTPAGVWKDQLLPLAKIMRGSIALERQGLMIRNVIVTAREMLQTDYDYLNFHGLHAGLILERGKSTKDHYRLRDAEYKRQWLEMAGLNPANIIAYDDMPEILGMYRAIGAQAFDARKLNTAMGHTY